MALHPIAWINTGAFREQRDHLRRRSESARRFAGLSQDHLLSVTQTLLIGLSLVFMALTGKLAALIFWPHARLEAVIALSVLAAGLAVINVLQVRSQLKDHQRETERLFTGEERFVRDCTVAMCAPPLGLSDPSAQISDNHARAEARLRGLEPTLALARLYARHGRDLVAGYFAIMLVMAAFVSVGTGLVILAGGALTGAAWALGGVAAAGPLLACLGWWAAVRVLFVQRSADLQVCEGVIEMTARQFNAEVRNLGLQRAPFVATQPVERASIH